MKFTQAQLIELARKVGVKDAEIVEEDKDSDFDISAAITAIDATRSPIIKQKVDAEIRESLTTQIQGEVYGRTTANLAKEFGMSRSQIEGAKTVNEACEIVKAHYASSLDGDKAETEKKYNDLVAKMNEEKASIASEWEGKYKTLEREHTTGKMVEYIQGKLKDAPVTWDKSVAAKEIFNHADQLYDVKMEEGVLKYYEKGSNRFALNAAKTEAISDMDIAREYLESRNGWATDMRNALPPPQTGGKLKANPYVDKQQGDKVTDSWSAIEKAREQAGA